MDNLISFIKEDILIFDIIFLLFIFYFSIQCFAKGFFISLMSFLKWVLALVITIILVPRIEPFVADYVKNEYLSGIGLGIAIYILSLFILILVGKSLGRLFSYTGLGPVDKFFGLFFGVFKGYVFIVCIFSTVNWFYSYEKWDMSLNKSFFFSVTEKGSRLLIEEFPERNQIEDTKKEIENI